MILTVEIRVVNAVREGVSAASGKPWKNQELIVAWKEQLPDGRSVENITVASLSGETVDKFAAMGAKVGSAIQADIAFGTRSYNNKVYCENRIYL